MHLKTILNRIEAQRGFIYDDITLAERGREICIEVSLRPDGRGSGATCSGCQRPGNRIEPSYRCTVRPKTTSSMPSPSRSAAVGVGA